jgi:hypothetical protein
MSIVKVSIFLIPYKFCFSVTLVSRCFIFCSRVGRGVRLLMLMETLFAWTLFWIWKDHSHKVSGSMGSRYGVAVRGTLLARDFYTSGRKWTREPGSGSTNLGRGSKVVNPFYVTMGKTHYLAKEYNSWTVGAFTYIPSKVSIFWWKGEGCHFQVANIFPICLSMFLAAAFNVCFGISTERPNRASWS